MERRPIYLLAQPIFTQTTLIYPKNIILNMFPSLYHAHHSKHSEDIPMWLTLAKKNPEKILELGCGTGRVLVPLAKAGYQAFGIDHDFQMLSFLENNLDPYLKSKIIIFQGEITSYQLDTQFSLILLPCNTYSELSRLERLTVLSKAHDHLSTDGIFAISLPNPNLFWQLPTNSPPEFEEEIPHPPGENLIRIYSGWKRTKDYFIVHWYYDQYLSDGTMERVTKQVKHHLVSLNTYQDEIKEMNFQTHALYGDYDFTPFTDDSQQLIFLLTR
jgi:SAM-dependent methyltransferase